MSEMVERMKRALEPYLHDHITRQARDDAARAAIGAMVERVAAAMYESNSTRTWEKTEGWVKPHWRKLARAGIAAMTL